MKFHPDGKRFLIKEYPKDKEPRPVKFSSQLVGKLVRHFEREGLGEDDLVFPMRLPPSPAERLRAVPNPADLGLPNRTPPGAGTGTER